MTPAHTKYIATSNSQVRCRGNEDEYSSIRNSYDTHIYYLPWQVFVARENASSNYKISAKI